MSESIITAESLQETEDADQKQDSLDSPDENKDENLETIESENDATDDVDQSGTDETEKSEESAEDKTTESPSDTEESEEEQEEGEKKLEIEKLPKGVRARLNRQNRVHEREMNELRKKVDQQIATANQQQATTYDQATQIQNPFTGEIVDINSVAGQVAIQLTQASQVQEQVERQQKTEEAQTNLRRKLDKGRDKYEDFDDVTENAGITLSMLNAAYLSENTEELLYNLAKYKPKEIERISKLSPERQNREMVLLETKMNQSSKKKIVKKVPEPPSKIKGSGTSTIDESDLSFEDILIRRRKKERERLRR